ncbi:hypothetical protein [Paenibacillus sp. DYY-L-2]|uniref:hypothetical protein n=1 Tax=Paenibacillus sp. DYY-L-2 TaxID=3447013 RepID=UPI003F504AB9
MKKYFIAIVLVLVTFLVLLFNSSKQQYYGNNEELIEKVIHTIDGYEHRSISVLEVKDINETRIVGILADNLPGYIEFKRNNKGNYEWIHIEVTNEGTLGFYLPDMNKASNRKIMIVTNQDNQIAKISVEINNQLVEKSIKPIQSSVTWIDLPQTNNDEYRFDNYQYYDQNDQVVNNF